MQASYRLYPAIALALIAGGSILLEQSTRVDDSAGEAVRSGAPDFVAERARIVGFGVDGADRYELLAETIVHFPADDTIRLHQPRLLLRAIGSETRIVAQGAEVSPGGEQVDFAGGVRVDRRIEGDPRPTTLRSETLSVWPESHRARSDTPVQLTQGASTATALGLRADNLFGTLELIGNVEVHMPSRQQNPS